jgi:hypothetical protein
MPDDARTRAVIDSSGTQPGEVLTPERIETIQTAMHEELGRFIGTTSYFVLGSYGDDERPRLEAVQNELASGDTDAKLEHSGARADAFLMDEIHDISELFTSKFKLLVSYADHIIGVYEHSQGGHAWEAGYLDQPVFRDRTQIFYRVYKTKETQYEAYDAMFAHYTLSMERVDRAHTWETPADLLAAVSAVYKQS